MAEIIFGKHSYGKIRTKGSRRGRIIVGKYCSISEEVTAFMGGDHNITNISTFPFGHRRIPISKLMRNPDLPTTQKMNSKVHREIIIGNDVWIGWGAMLFRGVRIGDGAVIGAFSKITKDIPPYSVVVGDSRILKKRFTDRDIKFLLKLKWWDFDDQEVADIAPILHNPEISILREWARNHGKLS